MPILTDELPAPLALTELSLHSYKTICATNKCKYRKVALQCTNICKSEDCENEDAHDASYHHITEDEEDAQ